mgnify:CR=1 FL=1
MKRLIDMGKNPNHPTTISIGSIGHVRRNCKLVDKALVGTFYLKHLELIELIKKDSRKELT